MTSWDRRSLSERFEIAARKAENYLQEIGPKVVRQPSYQRARDETLAECWVFDRLHGRTFLDTRDDLLVELRNMRAHPPTDATVNDRKRFEAFYVRVVDRLIAEFEDSAR